MYYVCILTSNSCRHGSKQNDASLQCGFEKCGNNPWNFVSVFSEYFVYGCWVSASSIYPVFTATHLTGVVSVVSDVIEHGAAADKQKHRICKAHVFPIDREVCDVEMFCHSDILPGPSPGWSSSSSSPAPCLL